MKLTSRQSTSLSRRQLLQCAAVLASGTTLLPKAWSLNDDQASFIKAHKSKNLSPTLFNLQQRATVAMVAEHIIPETDTPGAIAAGVDRFIEVMVQHWFTEEERASFTDGLMRLETKSGSQFSLLPPSKQLKILDDLEEQAGDSAWFNLGNITRTWLSNAPFICQFKELTVLGFMLSEAGSTQFLRPNPMGEFDGGQAINGGSAYAAQIPIRVLQKDS